MKNGYDGAESEELIENYEISNDKIVITFLDGSNLEVPLTEENETNLLNQMLKQAEERSRKSSIYDLKQKKKKSLIFAISQAGITMLNAATFSTTDQKENATFASILGGLTATATVLYSLGYKFISDEIRELEKYDIYLSIRESLEAIDDPNIFSGIKKQGMPLNINTLDGYSLSDMKKIRKNLKRREEYKSYFNKDGSSKVLTKEIHR